MLNKKYVKGYYEYSLKCHAENYLNNERVGGDCYKSLVDGARNRAWAFGVVLEMDNDQIDADLANAIEKLQKEQSA